MKLTKEQIETLDKADLGLRHEILRLANTVLASAVINGGHFPADLDIEYNELVEYASLPTKDKYEALVTKAHHWSIAKAVVHMQAEGEWPEDL